MKKEQVVSSLKEILSDEQVLTSEELLKEYATDVNGIRMAQKQFGWVSETLATCILKIRKKEEAVEVLKFLNKEKIVIIPRTGGSGVSLGLETTKDSVVMDLSEMNNILEINEENLTVTCEAGVPLEILESTLNKKGYTTGHFPQSFPLAQMGGLVATRSIGQFSTKYGGIEDLLVGLEAVLPNGEEVFIKNSPRRSTGPDLRHVWLGSEGTMGVITRVTVKIFPSPEQRWMQAYTVDSFATGLKIIKEIVQAGWKPAVVRLHDSTEAKESYSQFVEKGQSILLFISEGPKALTEAEGNAIDTIAKKHDAKSVGEKPLEIWLVHRNDICDHLDKYAKMGLVADTCEISAMWSDIGKIYEEVIERVSKEVENLIAVTGHSSHSYMQGTNIYFMMGALPEQTIEGCEKTYNQLFDIIMETTLKYNGSICHHHGVGRYRAKWMTRELGTSYQMLEALKKANDPNSIMNMGALLPEKK